MKKNYISGWGNNKKIYSNIFYPSNLHDLKKILSKKNKIITRGLGRSYGDSAVQKNCIILSNFKKIISFDKKRGFITVQAGLSLKDLLEEIIPYGWFIPVSPGTKYVTIGGMIASNVHGKNQHLVGCIINHISYIKLLINNKIVKVKKNSKLFNLTFGGMGLTGVIVEIKIKLLKIKNDKILQEKIFFNKLSNLIDQIKVKKNHYSVAWLDCFSLNLKNKNINSILYLGEHCKKIKEPKNKFKFSKPLIINNFYLSIFSFFMNDFFIKIFNFTKYFYEKFFQTKKNLIGINNFFYPLDKFKNWNKLYGKKGFIQYQFAVPYKSSEKLILKVLSVLNQEKLIPYLAVLKNMKKDNGALSFSLNGISLALDIPYSKKVLRVVSSLDDLILEHKGKIYLTKDSILKKKQFKNMYDQFEFLKNFRKKYKIENLKSYQSERLGI